MRNPIEFFLEIGELVMVTSLVTAFVAFFSLLTTGSTHNQQMVLLSAQIIEHSFEAMFGGGIMAIIGKIWNEVSV